MLSSSSKWASQPKLTYYLMRSLSPATAGLIKIEGNKRNHRGNSCYQLCNKREEAGFIRNDKFSLSHKAQE